MANIKIGGVETVVKVPELEPLDVRLTTLRGDAVKGTGGNARNIHYTLRAVPTDVDTKTTIVDSINGLSKGHNKLIVNPGAGQKKPSQSGSVYGGGRYLRNSTVKLPIEEVDSIQLQLP